MFNQIEQWLMHPKNKYAGPAHPEFSTVMVTPEFAAVALEANIGNRPAKKRSIESYARDMKAKKWALTGEAIIFDWNWHLRNGQNRLRACIDSDCAFATVVVTGIDPDAFDRMDRHAKRSVSDVLAINHEMASNHLAACCALLFHWEQSQFTSGSIGSVLVSISEIEAVLARHPGIRNFRKGYADRAHGMKASDAVFAVADYLLSQIDKDKAAAFFDAIHTGNGSGYGDPRLALRSRLIKDSVRRRTIRQVELMALIFKTWNYWVSGKSAKRTIVWRIGDEEFPTLVRTFKPFKD
jgi:hypothetical protein